jgi:dihydrofolate synthase / folylpolyglutamate synthase
MQDLSSLNYWESYISSVHSKPMDFTLDRVRKVANKLGLLNKNKNKNKIITIAGTNGKGSTANFLSKVLEDNNIKVGLFTSPHMLKINERFKINNTDISDEELIEAFSAIDKARLEKSDKLKQGILLTYFEFCTLAAFWLFKKNNCDVWILEVGLGGRLDSVNILDADIAILTTIGLDHTDILGDSIEKIAAEKMGIFRRNQKIFCADKSLFNIVSQKTKLLNSDLYCAGYDFSFNKNNNLDSWDCEIKLSNKIIKYSDLPVPGVPVQNIAVSLMVLCTQFPDIINSNNYENKIKDYIFDFKMLGRMSILKSNITGFPADILFDGAHNPQAANNLAKNLVNKLVNKLVDKGKSSPDFRVHIIFCALSDKDIYNILKPVCDILKDKIKKDVIWYLPKLENTRASRPSDLKNILLNCYNDDNPNIVLIDDNIKPVNNLRNNLRNNFKANDFILAFGSFCLLDYLLDNSPDNSPDN